MRGYTDTANNLRYTRVGEMVERALAEYSNGLLERVNLPGVDLLTKDKTSYESKVTQFKNKSGRAVRGLIVKNPRTAFTNDYEDKLADYFILSDVKSGKACCISSRKFYNFRDSGAQCTVSCDPNPTDFFLTGYNTLYNTFSAKGSRDYFEESEALDLQFIRSIN